MNSSVLKRIVPQRDVFSTVAMMVLLLGAGSVLIWQMVKLIKLMDSKDGSIADACKTNKWLIVSILALACLMVVLPIVLLVLNLSGFRIGSFKTLNIFENVMKTQAIIFTIAIINLALVFILHIRTKACVNLKEVELPTWIASGVLAASSLALLGVRYFEDAKETRRIREQIKNQPTTFLGSVRSGLSNFGRAGANFISRINPF